MDKAHKRVLLLGSGMMAESVADQILKRAENHLTIASNILEDAKKLASKKERCTAVHVDVTSDESLVPLVRDSDIVISQVPATFHIYVAKVCLKEKKNLVTSSQVSPQLAELDDEVRKNGLIFLNELGLDPGIDHLLTMKNLDEVKSKGGKVLEQESWCGGLPSPECCDNPLGYKFSWSPISALSALRNEAKYIENGEIKVVPSEDLLFIAEPKDISMALSLEGYPNRDSLTYQQLYGLQDTKKVLRGTLRYRGFSLILGAIKEIGILSNDEIQGLPEKCTWNQYLSHLLKDTSEEAPEYAQKIFEDIGLEKDHQKIAARVVNRVMKNKFFTHLDEQERSSRLRKLLSAFKWMKIFSNEVHITPKVSHIQNFCNLLEKRLAYGPGEADLVIMQKIFKIQYKDSDRVHIRRTTLVAIGEKYGKSAMSMLVGTPTGVGTQLILDGKITQTGVIRPLAKEVYEPVLKLLHEAGIRYTEVDE